MGYSFICRMGDNRERSASTAQETRVLYIGGRMMRTGGVLAHTVLGLDFTQLALLAPHSGLADIPFQLFYRVSLLECSVIRLTTKSVDIPPIELLTYHNDDASEIYQLLENIIDNRDQLKIPHSTLFQNLFDSYKSQLCVRHSAVLQKSLKIRGQSSRLQHLMKKSVKVPSEAVSHNVCELLLTESHLYCLNESGLPSLVYPSVALEWKLKAQENVVTFTCDGDKGIFQFADEAATIQWYNACRKSKEVRDDEILSLEPIERELRRDFQAQFDRENSEHVQLLRRLWEAARLGEHPEDGSHIPFAIQHDRWRVIGFQRDDPSSDLRASGLLGLRNLVYFAETYTGLFLHLAQEQLKAETDMYYPFATAGINISYLMAKLLALQRKESFCPTMSMYPLFFYKPNAWEELYTIIFRFFDQKWKRMKVGYMGFQQVLDATEEGISELLHKPMRQEVPPIFDMLGILLEDLDSFRNASLAPSLSCSSSFPRLPDSDAPPESAEGSTPSLRLEAKQHRRNLRSMDLHVDNIHSALGEAAKMMRHPRKRRKARQAKHLSDSQVARAFTSNVKAGTFRSATDKLEAINPEKGDDDFSTLEEW